MNKLEIQDLHKSYGSHQVLKGVSLQAKAGDVISIIGSSGSGKSTFLRCINLLEQPNAGQIPVNGEQLRLRNCPRGGLRAADPRQLQRLRSRLSMVFQHFNLWSHMSTLDNVMQAPVHVLGMNRKQAREKPSTTCTRSASAIAVTPTQHTCPEASSSAWRSHGPWPWSRRSCCSTSRPRRSTRSWSARC